MAPAADQALCPRPRWLKGHHRQRADVSRAAHVDTCFEVVSGVSMDNNKNKNRIRKDSNNGMGTRTGY